MKYLALALLVLASLALLLIPSDAPSEASPDPNTLDAAILDASPTAPEVLPAAPSVAPSVPVVLERTPQCADGVCFDLPAKKQAANHEPRRVFRGRQRGCGIFGLRCR